MQVEVSDVIMTIEPPTRVQTELDDEACYAAMQARDTAFDGAFVICVKTTGIYCRPSCTVRQPFRKNIYFLPSNEAAEAAGFRACKRCKPKDNAWTDSAPDLVHRATAALDEANTESITVQHLADIVGATTGALNSAFRRVLGVTAQEYAAARKVERFKDGVRSGGDVTTAMYDAGYGSSSRLYENASKRLGMTPGAYQRGGRGMTIAYQTLDSPAGRMIVAATEYGVCSVRFGAGDDELVADVHREFPEAAVKRDEGRLGEWIAQIGEHVNGLRPRLDIPLDIQGTAFQWRVWRALQEIGYGRTKSYKQVAADIGQPTAVRAVARACATNKAAVLIPCHRVVGSDGSLTGYAYGVERKAALLEMESANLPSSHR